MERNNKVTIAVCPRCGASCLPGHDEDGQICCAKCGSTFKPKDFKEYSPEEYKEIIKNAHIYERGGWTAYLID